jgi:hypothetical protein
METRNERLKELFNGYDNLSSWIDLSDYILDSNVFDSSEDLRDYIEERIREQEIIYYSSAMDYLKDNDNSLRTSLEIAYEMGFELQNVNSELLATLLLQGDLMEDLVNFIYEVENEEIFND